MELFHHETSQGIGRSESFPDKNSTSLRLQELYSENVKAAGFKLAFPVQYREYPDVWQYLSSLKQDIKIICCYRQNFLKKYISEHNILRVIERQKQDPDCLQNEDFNLGKATIDISNVMDFIIKAEEESKHLIDLARTFPFVHIITYESLLKDEKESCARILTFLGVDPDVELQSLAQKITPDSLREAIENYDELSESLQGTPFEELLESDTCSRVCLDLPPVLSTPLQNEYDEFLKNEPPQEEICTQSLRAVSHFNFTPMISIIVPVYYPEDTFYRDAIASVLSQTYTNWELIIVHDGPQPDAIETISKDFALSKTHNIRVVQQPHQSGISASTNTGAANATGQYIAFLDHDDLLEPHALESVVSTMQHGMHTPDFFYSDHDKIDIEGRRYEPEFKPDWSPETLLAHCYIGHLTVISRTLFLELGGLRKEYDSAQDYDLFLRLSEVTSHIEHIPKILYHWRNVPGSTAESAQNKPQSLDLGKAAVQEALARRGKRGKVIHPTFATTHSIGVHALEFDPTEFCERITIVIPTKDRLDLLETCIRSIREHTNYPHYEILVINNNSTEQSTFDFLNKEDIPYIDVQTDTFNFSTLMNTGIHHSTSPYVLLLNNDTEVLCDGWLTSMIGILLLDDSIGAVGAKLLFNDDTLQHAGVVLGPNDGTAMHANKHLPSDESGYRNSIRAMRNYSMVTAACMLTRVDKYLEVGGFNEQKLPISYNDVDYCLKLIAKGYRVVYTPDAVLRHHEGASRKHSNCSKMEYDARAYIRHTWQPLLRDDPYYNPNLSLSDGCFHLRRKPRGKSILFASHNLEYQGASLFLLELAQKLHAHGFHVEVTAPGPGPLAALYEQSGIPIHVQEDGNAHPMHLMNKGQFDILFLNTITTYQLLQELDIGAHTTLWCIHESERDVYFETHEDLSAETFSKVSHTLFVSDATRSIYKDLSHNHAHTIHNGIDIQKIDTFAMQYPRKYIREDLGIAPNAIVITCIGTICPRKGQRALAEVAVELLATATQPLVFLFVGGGAESEYGQELQSFITAKECSEYIKIIPTTPDVYRYYSASDIFVCNSTIESFPRVILEAMAWELPIVATDIFGIPEQIHNDVEGILIPPEQNTALQNALTTLIDNKGMRTALARNARIRVEKEFGIDMMVKQYEDFFDSVSQI